MAVKFPRLFFPLGGGARRVDADTAIVDEPSPTTPYDLRDRSGRFGETLMAGPRGRAARGRRGRRLPAGNLCSVTQLPVASFKLWELLIRPC